MELFVEAVVVTAVANVEEPNVGVAEAVDPPNEPNKFVVAAGFVLEFKDDAAGVIDDVEVTAPNSGLSVPVDTDAGAAPKLNPPNPPDVVVVVEGLVDATVVVVVVEEPNENIGLTVTVVATDVEEVAAAAGRFDVLLDVADAVAGEPNTKPAVVVDEVDDDTAAGVLKANPSKTGFFSSAGLFAALPKLKPSVVDEAEFEPKLNVGTAAVPVVSDDDEEAVEVVADGKVNLTLGDAAAAADGVDVVVANVVLVVVVPLAPNENPVVANELGVAVKFSVFFVDSADEVVVAPNLNPDTSVLLASVSSFLISWIGLIPN